MMEDLFTEENRIQGLIDDAVREKEEEFQAENLKNKTTLIPDLNKSDLSPEKNAEISKTSLDFVNQVLKRKTRYRIFNLKRFYTRF